MKQCHECFTFSPNDARFCIECSNPFAETGATERLTPYPQSSMGCHVVDIGSSNGGSRFIPIRIIPGYSILIGTLGSENVSVFNPEIHMLDLGSAGVVTIVDHKRGY